MGGDGGVIAAKRRFMRQGGDDNASKEKVNEKEQAKERTRLCAITNEPLQWPVVACELGYLYNKDAIIAAILEKTLNAAFSHIRGMKDLITVKFTEKKGQASIGTPVAASAASSATEETDSACHVCPITMEEFNGVHPFVVIKSTGFVISEKAVKEVGIAGLQQEYGPFVEDDLIRVACSEDERERLRDRMLARRERARKEKKEAKEGKKRKATTEASAEGSGDSEEADSGGDKKADAALEEANKKEKKALKKAKKEQKAAASAAAAASVSASAANSRATTSSSSVATTAQEVVRKAMLSSSVLNGLLVSSTKATNADTLFMTNTGLRYTLG